MAPQVLIEIIRPEVMISSSLDIEFTEVLRQVMLAFFISYLEMSKTMFFMLGLSHHGAVLLHLREASFEDR